MATCVLCDDTGYRGIDAYGERVWCGCKRETATVGTTGVLPEADQKLLAEMCEKNTAATGELLAGLSARDAAVVVAVIADKSRELAPGPALQVQRGPGELHAWDCQKSRAVAASDREALKAALAGMATRSGSWMVAEPGMAFVPPTPPVSRLELKPGDRLVLTVDGKLGAARREALVGQVRFWLGRDDVQVLVLEGGARLTVLGREDTAGEPGGG